MRSIRNLTIILYHTYLFCVLNCCAFFIIILRCCLNISTFCTFPSQILLVWGFSIFIYGNCRKYSHAVFAAATQRKNNESYLFLEARTNAAPEAAVSATAMIAGSKVEGAVTAPVAAVVPAEGATAFSVERS